MTTSSSIRRGPSLTGNAERLSVSKFGGGVTRFQSVLQRFSPGFETNDLGFQSRADEQMFRNWFSLQFNKPTKVLRSARFFNFNTMQKWTTEGLPTTVGREHELARSVHELHVGSLRCERRATSPRPTMTAKRAAVRRCASPQAYEVWTGIESDSRKAYTRTCSPADYRNDLGITNGWWVNPSAQFRVWSQLSASVGLELQP